VRLAIAELRARREVHLWLARIWRRPPAPVVAEIERAIAVLEAVKE